MSLGYTILVLVVYVLAVARVTRLINFDSVLDPVRVAVARVFGPGSKIVYFLGCPWCVGWWAALVGAAGPVMVIGWPWWATLPIALAASHLVGVAAALSAGDEIEFETVEE